MSKTAMIRARIEPDLKSEAEAVLKEIGLSTSELITMTFRQVIMHQGLPFEARIPNAETVAAIREMNADRAAGNLTRYTSVADMMADLD